jgi:transcriptional regulator of arginine metabolism
MSWREQLPQILVQGSFRTQGEIISALGDLGHHVDQAMVSRELRALGAAKVDGAYRIGNPTFGLPVLSYRVTGRDSLVVVKTSPALAMALAQAIDAEDLDGVLGTVAGDDTVFVATQDRQGVEVLSRFLGVQPPGTARRPAIR